MNRKRVILISLGVLLLLCAVVMGIAARRVYLDVSYYGPGELAIHEITYSGDRSYVVKYGIPLMSIMVKCSGVVVDEQTANGEIPVRFLKSHWGNGVSKGTFIVRTAESSSTTTPRLVIQDGRGSRSRVFALPEQGTLYFDPPITGNLPHPARMPNAAAEDDVDAGM